MSTEGMNEKEEAGAIVAQENLKLLAEEAKRELNKALNTLIVVLPVAGPEENLIEAFREWITSMSV